MVEIKGPRVTLRSYKKSDASRIAKIANNINIAQNMSRFPHPYALEDAKQWLEHASGLEKNKADFAIIYDNEIVGGVGIDLHDGQHEGVACGGYWLGEDYWGKGIATEAWILMRNYAFENFDIRKLEASVYSWNPASARIQEKCGLVKEGCKRDSVIRFGKMGDEILYGMTRKDWEKLKSGDSKNES